MYELIFILTTINLLSTALILTMINIYININLKGLDIYDFSTLLLLLLIGWLPLEIFEDYLKRPFHAYVDLFHMFMMIIIAVILTYRLKWAFEQASKG